MYKLNRKILASSQSRPVKTYVFPDDYCDFADITGGVKIVEFHKYGIDGNAPQITDAVLEQYYGEDIILKIGEDVFRDEAFENFGFAFNSGVDEILARCFQGCGSMLTFNLPTNAMLREAVLKDCTSLTEIDFKSCDLREPGIAINCTSLTFVNLLHISASGVPQNCFYGCPLTRIIIGDRVTCDPTPGTFGTNGDFFNDYYKGGSLPGEYEWDGGRWVQIH